MAYFVIGMAIAIIGSVVGDFLIKEGTMKVGGPTADSFGGIQKLLNPRTLFQYLQQSGITHNWKLWLGIAVLAVHFGGYLLAMRVAAVTMVVPLMASTYILETILAQYILRERVTLLRWVGVSVVVVGLVGLINTR